jgi:hypothetical protein
VLTELTASLDGWDCDASDRGGLGGLGRCVAGWLAWIALSQTPLGRRGPGTLSTMRWRGGWGCAGGGGGGMLLIRTERRFPAMVLLPLSRCRSATAWLRIRLLWRRGLGRGNMEIRVERSGIALVNRAVICCGSVRCHGADRSFAGIRLGC